MRERHGYYPSTRMAGDSAGMSLISQLYISQAQLVAGVKLDLLMWGQFLSVDFGPVERIQVLDRGAPVTVRDARVAARDGLGRIERQQVNVGHVPAHRVAAPDDQIRRGQRELLP